MPFDNFLTIKRYIRVMGFSGKEEVRMQEKIMVERYFACTCEHIGDTVGTTTGTTCSLEIIAWTRRTVC
ncbi:hypothetical protein SDC9_151941 [bioreactor metagenome]|uniref:Uncharacterized protein n=1 Tax=bioreactor metagenome TaxID=1076179 RepID=A0A645ETE8_9ZZZZ